MARIPVFTATTSPVDFADIEDAKFDTSTYDEVTFMAALNEGESVEIFCAGSNGWVTARDSNGPIILGPERSQVVLKGGITYGFTKSATGSPVTVDAFTPVTY